jgi:Cytochrome c oxidase assembly protein CtaG/Cox11
MNWNSQKIALTVIAVLLLLLPSAMLLKNEERHTADKQEVLVAYLRALYARDFKRAYTFISAQDRQLKAQDVYEKEQGAFSGFTAEVAQKLSRWIEAIPLEERTEGDRVHLKLKLTLPDANELAPRLLNWDEEQLNKLPLDEQKKLLGSLDQLKQSGTLKMITGDQEFALIKEGSDWKVFLDWAAGVRVVFDSTVPPGAGIDAEPAVRQTVVHPGDLFTVDYRVRNDSAADLVTRIVHRVEPETLADHLDLVECALLFPVRLRPHEEQIYRSTYLIRGDLPEGTRELKVVYEFTMER